VLLTVFVLVYGCKHVVFVYPCVAVV
jgi:hypothetical protein